MPTLKTGSYSSLHGSLNRGSLTFESTQVPVEQFRLRELKTTVSRLGDGIH
jgi:hypothetical protein